VAPADSSPAALLTPPQFTAGTWALLMANILVAALFMPFFEARNGHDFADVKTSTELAGHALYLASMGPSKSDAFEPATAGGRAAGALHSFSLVLIMASYTANLAAKFTTSTPPYQAITGVQDFTDDLPMCTRGSSTLMTYLNNSYPDIYATLEANNTFGLTTVSSRAALGAVLSGQCAGALLPAPEVSWLMNVNDTRGDLCALVPVGDAIGAEEGMPLTFSTNALTPAQLEAVNSQLNDLMRTGQFLLGLQDEYFAKPPRRACAREDAADAGADAALKPGGPLEAMDLAGAFMLQGVGLLLGAALHLTKQQRRRVRERVAAAWEARTCCGGGGGKGHSDAAACEVPDAGAAGDAARGGFCGAEEAPWGRGQDDGGLLLPRSSGHQGAAAA
jgi:hypothetical protein